MQIELTQSRIEKKKKINENRWMAMEVGAICFSIIVEKKKYRINYSNYEKTSSQGCQKSLRSQHTFKLLQNFDFFIFVGWFWWLIFFVYLKHPYFLYWFFKLMCFAINKKLRVEKIFQINFFPSALTFFYSIRKNCMKFQETLSCSYIQEH